MLEPTTFLWPSLRDIQAETGLIPRVRNTSREFAREAEVLLAWNTSLMPGRRRPKFSVRQLRRTLSMKVENTRVQAMKSSLDTDRDILCLKLETETEHTVPGWTISSTFLIVTIRRKSHFS